MSAKISFIIPAFNEEKHIESTLASLWKASVDVEIAEVIVINNCSTDRTAEIAEKSGAKVITIAGGPIARLRNIGVAASTGEILIFIDADVEVTDAWRRAISDTVSKIEHDPLLVTGSHCSIPENSTNWLERYWFASFEKSSSAHLGTGHLIMSRALFDRVGGFSNLLETGEDYDICTKVRREGGEIKEDVQLKVVHKDFPKSIGDFVKREAWHGKGDSKSLAAIFNSKVAIASLVFMVVHLAFVFFIAFSEFYLAFAALLFLMFFLVAVSHIKFSVHGYKVVMINAGIYYFYLVGRSWSIVKHFRSI